MADETIVIKMLESLHNRINDMDDNSFDNTILQFFEAPHDNINLAIAICSRLNDLNIPVPVNDNLLFQTIVTTILNDPNNLVYGGIDGNGQTIVPTWYWGYGGVWRGYKPAMLFNGVNNYVNFPTSVSPSTALTMEAWAKSNTPPSSSLDFIGGNGTTGGKGYWLGITTTGAPIFALTSQVVSPTKIPFGTWFHIAGTWDGSNQRLYVNGVLVSSAAAVTTPIDYTGSSNLMIGSLSLDAARFWDGSIGEVRIWNIARTQTQIQTNMNNQLVGNETGLVGYWKFDENSGLIAYDSTANGNNGTLKNGTSWLGTSWVSY